MVVGTGIAFVGWDWGYWAGFVGLGLRLGLELELGLGLELWLDLRIKVPLWYEG